MSKKYIILINPSSTEGHDFAKLSNFKEADKANKAGEYDFIQKYEFDTIEEIEAFYDGLECMDGWQGYPIMFCNVDKYVPNEEAPMDHSNHLGMHNGVN